MGKRRRTAQRTPSGYGFDYGIGITVAAVGSMGFNQNLVDAEIVAVAYGLEYSEKLGRRVPVITLVGRNAEPLREAFEEFSGWAERTDADAIELTIVFQKDGGYRLCISPEVGALYKRALHYDTVVNPVALQVTWIKIIETTSPASHRPAGAPFRRDHSAISIARVALCRNSTRTERAHSGVV